MGFSSILDISSFFIGMIINLIFVALMCYYFKRKYEYLEVAQNEQAKILYQLIHKPQVCQPQCMDFSQDPLTHLKKPDPQPQQETDSDSESDESDDEFESNDYVVNEIKDVAVLNDLNVEEVKMVDLNVTVEEVNTSPMEITLNLEDTDNSYNKMSMKQLKELLSSKGIKAKNNIRKDELIELITKENTVAA
jgi:hypothetical protein